MNRDDTAVHTLVAAHLPKACAVAGRHWIGGAWVASRSGETFVTLDPTTGRELHQVARAAPADVDDAVAAASAAAPAWRDFDGIERGRILRRAADLIRARSESFAILDTLDAGRPIRDTGAPSTEGAARLFDYYAGLADKLRGATQPMGPAHSALIEYEPHGVVGALAPWNYPLSNAATKLAPALACGNTVVLKPAEQAPLSTLLLGELLHQAGIPAGVVNVVTGYGHDAGARLVDHPQVNHISFTGSTATGRIIGAKCGGRIRPVTLELGGKSANIVFADADLAMAAKGTAFTILNNQGQTCSAGTRLIVHRSVAGELLDRFRGEVSRLRVGDPMRAATHVGPLVSQEQLAAVEAKVADGRASGGLIEPVAVGEYAPVAGGYFIEPLLVRDADPKAGIAQSEIFGPVLCVFTFDTDDEALALANDTEYGLAAVVWTRSLASYERARRELEAGLIWVNCPHDLHPGVPVSGFRNSGLGSEYGAEAMLNYMKQKSTVSTWLPWRSGFDDVAA
jgi:aldehyde dehydrogenase (NAD+)